MLLLLFELTADAITADILERIKEETAQLESLVQLREDIGYLLQQPYSSAGEYLFVDARRHQDLNKATEQLAGTLAQFLLLMETLSWRPSNAGSNEHIVLETTYSFAGFLFSN